MQLIETMRWIGLDDLDIQLLKNLYWNQSAIVRIDEYHETDSVSIKRSVRQLRTISSTF